MDLVEQDAALVLAMHHGQYVILLLAAVQTPTANEGPVAKIIL